MAKHTYATSPPNLTGMPPGVPYIIGNEAAERFSYYGMKSVLTVFMAHYLLNQSGVLAPMSDNQAYMYSHVFVLGVYALPVLGAILADGFFGKYRTILSLSIVYCLGNLTLACMATTWGIAIGQRTMLAIGLFLICLGAGGIKPCVSANVGDQFGESNKHLLSKMFGWFYFSINAGSFISSILCPWLLANPKWGPGWAFGIPGIAMLIATLFFWGGRNRMVHVPPAGLGYLKETFSKEGLLTLGRIAMVYVFILVFWALWGMSNGVEWTLQAEKMDLHWMGMNLIAAQVQTANPILILIFIPIVNYVIYPAIDKVFPLTPSSQNRDRSLHHGLVICRDRLDSRSNRCRIEAEHQLAISRLRYSYARRSDGFDYRLGIFLHPGAEFDEEFGHGAVAPHCRLGRGLRGSGQ